MQRQTGKMTRRAGRWARCAAGGLLLTLCSIARAARPAGGGENDPDARFRGTGKADFVRIGNVTCRTSGSKGAGVITFDIAWDHSWRAAWEVSEEQHGGKGKLSIENWDAAWVFVKVRKPGDHGWSQGTLSTDRAHHTVPAGATLDVGLSDDGKRGAGVFIYRDGPGHGANNWKGVALRWMHAADGVPDVDRATPSNDKLTQWLTGAGIVPELGNASAAGGDLAGLQDGEDGLPSDNALERLLQGDDGVEIQVHAIGMVYVPEGAFWAGDGATPAPPGSSFWAVSSNDWEWAPLGKSERIVAGQFSAGDTTDPFRVESEEAMKLGGESRDILNNRDAVGMHLIDDFNIDQPRTLPAAYPKGYGAFYCMKYELTQGRYVAFLNTIANADAYRYSPPPDAHNYRYSIVAHGGPLAASEPYVACNYLSSGDGLAYAAWAGLRPMTELEYEKACRGPLKPVPNECAWGTDRVAGMDGGDGGYTIRDVGRPGESVTWAGSNGPDATHGNALWGGTAKRIPAEASGPLRVGIFATPQSDRVRAGASYWGIMELSGNLTELVVTVGSPAGRDFAGTHGDGRPGHPDGWHFVERAGGGDAYQSSGVGSRGGGGKSLRTSSRGDAVVAGNNRSQSSGFRAVRRAP